MKLLYNVWLEEFLCYLTTLKLHYDEGGDTAIKIFSDCDYDYESFEEDGYGKMYDAAEHVKCKTIYYPDENGQINDDCEPSYDIWFMSSRDMTEFYKTLNRLYQEKRISFKEYSGYKREMYDMAREYILYTNAACYGGASFYLRTKTNHKETTKLVNSQLCTIYIYDDEKKEWIGKTDGAENTDFEAVKGGLSDAFKRAAVKWNIGRYMYSFDAVWVDLEDEYGKPVIAKHEKQKLQNVYYDTVIRLFGNGAIEAPKKFRRSKCRISKAETAATKTTAAD